METLDQKAKRLGYAKAPVSAPIKSNITPVAPTETLDQKAARLGYAKPVATKPTTGPISNFLGPNVNPIRNTAFTEAGNLLKQGESVRGLVKGANAALGGVSDVINESVGKGALDLAKGIKNTYKAVAPQSVQSVVTPFAKNLATTVVNNVNNSQSMVPGANLQKSPSLTLPKTGTFGRDVLDLGGNVLNLIPGEALFKNAVKGVDDVANAVKAGETLNGGFRPVGNVNKAINNTVKKVEENVIDKTAGTSNAYQDVIKRTGQNPIEELAKRGEVLGHSGVGGTGRRVDAKKAVEAFKPEIDTLAYKRNKVFDSYAKQGVNVVDSDIDNLLAGRLNQPGKVLTPIDKAANTAAANYIKDFLNLNKDNAGGVSLKDLSDLKTSAWKDSSRFKAGLETGNSDVQDKVAQFAKELIESKIPDPRIKAINQELENLLAHKNFFENLDEKQQIIKSPKTLKMRVLGAVLNTPGASIAGHALGGGKLMDHLTRNGFNAQIASKAERKIIELKGKGLATPLDERVNAKIRAIKNKQPVEFSQDELNRLEDLNLIGDEGFQDVPNNVKAIVGKYKKPNISSSFAGAPAGITTDENGNTSFSPTNAALGVTGGLIGGTLLTNALRSRAGKTTTKEVAKVLPVKSIRPQTELQKETSAKNSYVSKNISKIGEQSIIDKFLENPTAPKNKANLGFIKDELGLHPKTPLADVKKAIKTYQSKRVNY